MFAKDKLEKQVIKLTREKLLKIINNRTIGGFRHITETADSLF